MWIFAYVCNQYISWAIKSDCAKAPLMYWWELHINNASLQVTRKKKKTPKKLLNVMLCWKTLITLRKWSFGWLHNCQDSVFWWKLKSKSYLFVSKMSRVITECTNTKGFVNFDELWHTNSHYQPIAQLLWLRCSLKGWSLILQHRTLKMEE